MRIIYLAHPISGNVKANLGDLRRIIRHINLTMPDVVPLAPYYADVVSMGDNIPSERERGIANGVAVLQSGCIDELWLTGERISSGMQNEMNIANMEWIPVENYIGKL